MSLPDNNFQLVGYSYKKWRELIKKFRDILGLTTAPASCKRVYITQHGNRFAEHFVVPLEKRFPISQLKFD